MTSRVRIVVLLTVGLIVAAGLGVALRRGTDTRAARGHVIVSTTKGVTDSGLLDVLVPAFEQKTGLTIEVQAIGTRKGLELAAKGETDVVLGHAPELERQALADGTIVDHRLVMSNEYVLVGPDEDPAQIRGLASATLALQRIADGHAPFVSRADQSGTHLTEQELWKQAGRTPASPWYVETKQPMTPTLHVANERRAYTVIDRAHWLVLQPQTKLVLMVDRDDVLVNRYAVMLANPGRSPRINATGAKQLVDFLLAPETQATIRTFGIDKYGQPLFIPWSPGTRK